MPDTEAEDRRLAAVAGRFDVSALIESGVVWTACRATERASGRTVVLRIVDDERLAQEANARAFLTEARLLASLNHPALIPVVDSHVDGRFAWTVSNPAPGTGLREVMRAGRMAPEEVAAAGEQIAAALDAAHARGVVHRDLRAEHVVQVAPGAYRLGGFGLGRWMMAGARRKDGTLLAGLPAVLAPELLGGGPPTVASDVHALGVMLFEMLTGVHPFAAADDATLLARLVSEQPARPSTLVPVPPELEQIILRALSKDPASRFVTAVAMQQALASCPGGSGAPSGQPRRQRTFPTWAEMLRQSQGPYERMKRAAVYLVPVLAIGGLLFWTLRTRTAAPTEDLMQRALAQVRLHPKDLGLRMQFGEQLERQGRVDDAKQLYQDALTVDPKYARAITGIARIQDRQGRPEEARKTYRTAIEADPKAWFAVLELARLLEKDARFHEARVLIEQGLAASPGQPDLTEELSRVNAARK